MNKIKTLEEARAMIASMGSSRVVMCHGAFDLLHIGHIRHLKKAREHGDFLVVTLTADSYINKGPGRPVFNEELRAENLAALECVDMVCIVNAVTAIPAIKKIKPSFYAKGSDYQRPGDDLTGNITREQDAVESVGGQILFTDEISFSSSNLLNENFNVFSAEVKDFLRHFRETFRSSEIVSQVKSLKKMKVLVVGDAIVDEYHYVEPLGQTGKGNILAVNHKDIEQFAGGSLAVANHVAGFCDDVSLLTGLGKKRSFEGLIREKLKSNVTPHFFMRDDAPTILKSRYVDGDGNKLFEVYYYDDRPVPPSYESAICDWIEVNIQSYDAVIVPDFGNGFISDRIAKALSAKSAYLAVNTQVNSGNRGYHVVGRYPKVNFASLNEPELRLAVHNRHDPIEHVSQQVGEMIGADYLAVTSGSKGLLLRDLSRSQSHQVPALSIKVIDRIGAGDAFLSLASLCLAGGLSPEIASFVGAAAAALDVQIVCNRESVEPTDLFKYIVTLLK